MKMVHCLNQNHSHRKLFNKRIYAMLIATCMLIGGCAQTGSELVAETDAIVVQETHTPKAIATATNIPTIPAATDTAEPTELPAQESNEATTIRREQVAVERDENLLRGTLIGDGEIAVLLAPGAMESRGSWMQFAEYIAAMGYTVLAFDFPGPFGTSTGDFKYDQVQIDALAMIEHLKGLGYEHIVCMGNSIGGGACYEAARIDPSLAGFAIISSPVESTVEDSAELTMPKLLVTGDELDVKRVLEETFELIPEPKQYVFINQKKHGTEMLNTDDQLRDTLVEFLEGIRNDLDLDQHAQVSGDEGGDQGTTEVEMRRENIEAAYEDRVVRGTLLGDGEVAVVLAPMFELTRSSWMSFAKDLAAAGYAALAFDYPGFGTSEGNFDWNKLDKDAAAVIDYLSKQGYEKIVCIGASSGASGCLGAASLRPEIAGLVLISDGISDPTKIENAELVMPKLLVYGDEDAEVTDIMDALYAGFPDPKQLVILAEKSHGSNLLTESDDMQPLLMEFLEGLRQE